MIIKDWIRIQRMYCSFECYEITSRAWWDYHKQENVCTNVWYIILLIDYDLTEVVLEDIGTCSNFTFSKILKNIYMIVFSCPLRPIFITMFL